MGGARVHALVVVFEGQLAFVPAGQEHQEHRGQHGHGVDGLVLLQAVTDGGQDEAGDFREAVGRHALVGVANGVVAEAFQHLVAVGGQVHRVAGAGQAGNDIFGGIVVGQLAHHGVACAFMDVAVAAQCATPGNAAVRRIEQANLGFFIGVDGIDQLGAHFFPGGAAVGEAVFDHPLDVAFGAQRGVVVTAGLFLHAGLQLRRRTRGDAVHHGVGEAHVGVDPGQNVVVANAAAEIAQAAAHTVTVVAQVVAVLQCDGAGIGRLAGAQQGHQRPVDGLTGFALLDAFDVGLQVGKAGVQFAVFQQVVAGFGDGERNDAGGRVGGQLREGLQLGIVGQYLVDGRDPLVLHGTVRVDGFQREVAILGGQGIQQGIGVGADVGPDELPARVTLFLEPLQVYHLVGAVEIAQAQVQDAGGLAVGGGCGFVHGAASSVCRVGGETAGAAGAGCRAGRRRHGAGCCAAAGIRQV